MGIGGRLALLKAAAEARGPLEPREGEDDNEFRPRKLVLPDLPPVDPEILFPESLEERARLAGGCAGLDCETFLIQPGRKTPRLVVTGYQAANGKQAIVTGDARDPTVHARAFLLFTEELSRVGKILVNQNIAFDFAVIAEDAHQCDVVLGTDVWFERVMARIFELLDRGLVEDTMLRERLIDLAEGTLGKNFGSLTDAGNPRRKKYTLQSLAERYLGVDLDKTTWRTGYARLHNKPIEEYEEGARKYITHDVETALHVATRQTVRANLHGLPLGERIPNSAEQSKAAFSFQLMASWGMRTDSAKVKSLETDLDHWSRRLLTVLKQTGLIRKEGKLAGTRDMKATQALVQQCYEDAGLVVPRTEKKGNVSTAGSVLEDIALIRLRGSSADVYDEHGQLDETELMKEPLYAYSQYTSIQKLQTTYLPVLYSGMKHPINASYETIVETGRASCYRPNLMNLPRGGNKTVLQRLQSRVRECFVPRPGFVYCSVDYNTLELCTLAQVCVWMLGHSKLADALNAGVDPHTLMAAEQFLHIPYEEAVARKKEKAVADMRQLVKALNFGLPGGLGAATFVEFAKASYNVYVTEDEARALKEKWFAQWPEMRPYFRMIGSMMRGYDEKGQTIGDIEQFVSGRIRGRTRYTAACNSFFQGLAADGAKAALYDLQKSCYLKTGALYGSRAVAFIHDEVIMEHPEDSASERAQIQAELMVKSMQEVCPDVKISASPALMRCWYKGADAVYDKNGRLVPWEPAPTSFAGATP